MGWAWTDWEDTTYAVDLALALEDQATGAIPDDSFVISRRVQLAAESSIPVADDALFIANHALKVIPDGSAGSTTGPYYGALPDDYTDMPIPDYSGGEVQEHAWHHALDGDGGASFTDWYTIDYHWAAVPVWDIPEGGHSRLFHEPGTITPNPGIDLYDPYITPIDADTQTVTVSWQLIGDTVEDDESYEVYIVVAAYDDADRPPFSDTLGDTATVSINDLTVDLTINKGERWSVFVQFSGASIQVVGNWVPRGNLQPDPATDAPSETSPGGRGFTVPSTWAWPLPDESGWDQDRCVLAGSTWETSSERAGITGTLPVVDSFTYTYTALDAANIRAYQGYWTIKGASTWLDHLPPSDPGPAGTDSTIQFLYGPSATYEYQWTAMGTIEVSVGGMLHTGSPATQVVADIELRPSAYTSDLSSLHVWKTRADLAAETPDADNVIEVDPSDGATLHVATNTTLTSPAHPDVLTPAPESFGEWGTVRAVVLQGGVQLIGQRRVKYFATPPPLQQRQRVAMTGVHATQAAAPDPPLLRAQGDL